jgi:hypothetical protein
MNNKFNNNTRVFTVFQVFKECSYFYNYFYISVEDRFNRVGSYKQEFFSCRARFQYLNPVESYVGTPIPTLTPSRTTTTTTTQVQTTRER